MIILALLIIVAVLIIYFYGRKQGRIKAEGPQVDYPQGGDQIPQGWSPVPLADELHDAMDGIFTLSGTKDEVWKKLRDLPTDEMVIAVYNTFGQKYFGEGNGTLTQWIRDENYYDYLTGVKETTLARLQRLNLP